MPLRSVSPSSLDALLSEKRLQITSGSHLTRMKIIYVPSLSSPSLIFKRDENDPLSIVLFLFIFERDEDSSYSFAPFPFISLEDEVSPTTIYIFSLPCPPRESFPHYQYSCSPPVEMRRWTFICNVGVLHRFSEGSREMERGGENINILDGGRKFARKVTGDVSIANWRY